MTTTNHLVPFVFEGHSVRVINRDGEPWFVAKDVAERLGYANTREAILDHCKTAQPVGSVAKRDSSSGLHPQTVIIPEADVYRLIMRSKLPSAERFENWVVTEVLPTIRRTGSYMAPAFDPASLSRLEILQLALASERRALELEKMTDELNAQVESQEETLTHFYGNGENLIRTKAADSLGVSVHVLSAFLRRHKYTDGRITGEPRIVQRYLTAARAATGNKASVGERLGYFCPEFKYNPRTGAQQFYRYLVTPLGLEHLRAEMKKFCVIE